LNFSRPVFLYERNTGLLFSWIYVNMEKGGKVSSIQNLVNKVRE
jgi:hypothetical protein